MSHRKKKVQKPSIVVYDNNYMEALYQTDLLAKKIMITASLKCQDMVWTEKGCEIIMSSNELREISGIRRGSLQHLEHAVKKLTETSVTVKNPKDPKHWIVFNYLPRGEYKHGTLSLLINSEMKPLIQNLQKNFTQYHIENIKPLKSEYSIRIFELLKMSAFKGKYRIAVENLKKMFGIGDKYKLYAHFKDRVLEPAKRELKEHCEIYFEYKEIKAGNKVVEIEFEIFKQKKDFSDYEEKLLDTVVKDIDFKELVHEKTSIEHKLNELGWTGNYQELIAEVRIEAVEFFINTIKRNLESINTTKVNAQKLHDYIDAMLRNNAESSYELYQAALVYDPKEEKKKSELAKNLIKLGFTGDPEEYILKEGSGVIEEALKIVEKQPNVTNVIGLLREKVKTLKIHKELIRQDQETKKKKDEEDQKLADEKARITEAKIKESDKKELEYDEKYSKYLTDFYEFYRANSCDDFLKDNFIKEFKQKFEGKGITKFSELGGIVKGCFFEWYNLDK